MSSTSKWFLFSVLSSGNLFKTEISHVTPPYEIGNNLGGDSQLAAPPYHFFCPHFQGPPGRP